MRKKIIFLILILLLLLLAVGLKLTQNERVAMANPQHPDHSMEVIAPTSDMMPTLSVCNSFARKYNLKTVYGYKSPDKKDFLLDMSSDELTITIIKTHSENIYQIFSYIDQLSKPLKVSTTALMKDLQTELEAIPGAKITVEY